jgi:hypothetical protein
MSSTPPTVIDFAVLWDWEFDYDFVLSLKRHAAAQGISFLDISVYNFDDAVRDLKNGSLVIRTLLDRASDADPNFFAIQDAVLKTGHVFNPLSESVRVMNKGKIHYELMAVGLRVPHTVLLPSYQSMPALNEALWHEVTKLALPFVLKPAHGAGGDGVIKNVTAHFHVIDGRKPFSADTYLAQERIYPAYLYGWRCWFRVYSIFGEVEIAWWDDTTSIYKPVSPADKARLNFPLLERMMTLIAGVAKLDVFSSEITLSRTGEYVAIDYINDPIDLRPKSRHYDGMPDAIMNTVAKKFIDAARERTRRE